MKKQPSWRVCPKCKSRATKIFSLATGKYQCQICEHEYEASVPQELELIADSRHADCDCAECRPWTT